MAATFPVGGTSGDYFSVNALSPIQRIGANGKQRWARDSTSLDKDWQITPTRGGAEPYPPAVVMGFNAVSPFGPSTDDGVTTGDLTGDGVDDIVFTARVGVLPYRPFTSPGSPLPNGTFVTVLDRGHRKDAVVEAVRRRLQHQAGRQDPRRRRLGVLQHELPGRLQDHAERHPLPLRRRQADAGEDMDVRPRRVHRGPVGARSNRSAAGCSPPPGTRSAGRPPI